MLGTGEVPEIVGAIDGADRAGASAPLTFFRDRHGLSDTAPRTARPAPGTLPDLHLRRRHAARPRDAAALRVREDRRGLRLQVRVLHHPDAARHYRSRPADSIVREARALAARGVKELLLISQDTTFYGIDRRERGALARLLRELNDVDGLEWIRLLYLYPTTIDDDTLDAMAECDKVCKYIDLPLQHASNPVLKRMKRPGTRQKYDALLDRIRARVPASRSAPRSSSAFPGETDADVERALQLRRRPRVRPRRRLHLLARGRHVGPRPGRRCAGANEDGAAQPGHEPAEAPRQRTPEAPGRRAGARPGRRPVERPRSGLEGATGVPGPRHRRIGLPDRLRSVELEAGDFAEVEIVGARDYDLIARPIG